MSWFSTPEARATIVVGIVTVVVQPIFLYAAFQFGKAQARAQVRHQKAVEAIVSALRIIEKLQSEFGIWVLYKKRDALEISHAKEISRLRDELRELIYDNSPWFEPRTEGKVRPVLTEVRLYYKVHTDALKSGDPAQIAESSKQISDWSKAPYALRVIALEDEARRLIGTKRHWRSTRRGYYGDSVYACTSSRHQKPPRRRRKTGMGRWSAGANSATHRGASVCTPET